MSTPPVRTLSVARLPAICLTLIALGALGTALTMRVPESKNKGTFWSDESTYAAMAYSLAFDGDITYERHDLERIYAAGYASGPAGVFLVRNPENGRIYFAKAFVYALVAAPFVRLLGDNGFFVLHALLLAAMFAAGYLYLLRVAAAGLAALYTVLYVLGSVAALYFFWLTPEWFNLSLVFLATFFWLYKERPPAWHGPTATTVGAGPAWLRAPSTDFLAAMLYGLAIYSKPPNAILLLPLLAWQAYRGRWLRGFALGLTATMIIAALFGATWLAIGDWNYMGGDRKTFHSGTGYPLQTPDIGFEDVGISMVTNLSDYAERIPEAGNLARDLIYIWIGRNGGMIPYMFPAVLALLLFLVSSRGRERMWSPHAFLAAGFLLEVVAIVIVVKTNWIGGGGTVGSRYFVNAYPAAFFLLPATASLGPALAIGIVWSTFVAQIVMSPFFSSFNPSFHTKRLPYTLLPVELTMLHDLPFNVHARSRLVEFDSPATFDAYFIDDETYRKERPDATGFWLGAAHEAEVILRTREPIDTITLRLRNRGRPNRAIVRMGGHVFDRALEPDERIEIVLPAGRAHLYKDMFLYRFSVYSETGGMPMFDSVEPGQAAEISTDKRPLGLLVEPSVQPARPLRGS